MNAISEKVSSAARIDRRLTSALSDQMLVSAANFLTGILLARILGIEDFGRFTLVWSLYLFAYALQGGMLTNAMMSISPKLDVTQRASYFSAVFIQSAIYSGITALLISGLLWLAELAGFQTGILALPMFVAVLFRLTQDIFRRYLFAEGKTAQALVHDAICYLGQLFLILVLSLQTKPGLSDVIYVHAFTAASSIATSILISGKLIHDVQATWYWTKRNWTSSSWLTISELMEWASNYAFLAAAGAFIGSSAVGAIRAGQNLMGLANILLLGLENVFPGQASKHYTTNGNNALRPFIRHSIYMIAGFMLTVVLITAPFSAFWMDFFYGSEFVQYSEVIIWIGLANLLAAVGIPYRVMLRTWEKTRPIFLTFFYSALSTMILAPLLAWGLGIYGVLGGMLTVAGIRLYLFYDYAQGTYE